MTHAMYGSHETTLFTREGGWGKKLKATRLGWMQPATDQVVVQLLSRPWPNACSRNCELIWAFALSWFQHGTGWNGMEREHGCQTQKRVMSPFAHHCPICTESENSPLHSLVLPALLGSSSGHSLGDPREVHSQWLNKYFAYCYAQKLSNLTITR